MIVVRTVFCVTGEEPSGTFHEMRVVSDDVLTAEDAAVVIENDRTCCMIEDLVNNEILVNTVDPDKIKQMWLSDGFGRRSEVEAGRAFLEKFEDGNITSMRYHVLDAWGDLR